MLIQGLKLLTRCAKLLKRPNDPLLKKKELVIVLRNHPPVQSSSGYPQDPSPGNGSSGQMGVKHIFHGF